MALQHPIFQTPYAVEPTFVDHKTPKNYRNYPEGVDLPESMRVWKVQTKDFPEIDVGLVSSPSGFNEADAEVISSGLNSKGPRSVALGRHGNFFLWGFFAQPEHLTEEGRKVFINAVSYIHRFDGQRPTARRLCMGRNDLAQYFVWAKNAPAVLNRAFGKDIVDQFAGDLKGLEAFINENLGYMHDISRMELRIDPDAQALGIANNDIALLDRCVELLDHADSAQTQRAQRILERYTDQTLQTPAEWQEWLTANRGRMFFSDVGGFRWYVIPE